MENIYISFKDWIETNMWFFVYTFIVFQLVCLIWLITWVPISSFIKIEFSYRWQDRFERIGNILSKIYKYITWIGCVFLAVYLLIQFVEYLINRF